MDFNISLNVVLKFITHVLLGDVLTLGLHLLAGFGIGMILCFILWRIIKKRAWFKRNADATYKKVLYFILRACFYLSVIGVSATIALNIGSNKIIKKEVDALVSESMDFCRANYFDDVAFIEDVFATGVTIYESGAKVNEMNHALADGMVEAVSKEYGLGFMGKFLFRNSKSELVHQIEGMEKAFIFFVVAEGLKQVGLGDAVEADQLDKAFYNWLHNEGGSGTDSVDAWISKQIQKQLKPLVFSIWLPFLIINILFILANVIEVIIYLRRNRRLNNEPV